MEVEIWKIIEALDRHVYCLTYEMLKGSPPITSDKLPKLTPSEAVEELLELIG